MRNVIKASKNITLNLIALLLIGSPVILFVSYLIGGQVFEVTRTVVIIGIMVGFIGVYAYSNYQLDRSLNPNR